MGLGGTGGPAALAALAWATRGPTPFIAAMLLALVDVAELVLREGARAQLRRWTPAGPPQRSTGATTKAVTPSTATSLPQRA